MEPAPTNPELPAIAAPAEAFAQFPRSTLHSRLMALGEVLLCSSIPTQVFLGWVLRVAGMTPVDQSGQLSLAFVVVLSVVDTAVLIALMVMLTRTHGQSARELWFGTRPVRREVVVGLLLIPPILLVVIVLLNSMRLGAPWLHNVPSNPLEKLAGTPAEAALFGIVAIVAGGVREELQRAFLLRRFTEHLGGTTVGIIVLSVAFGIGHIVQGWDAVITTGVLGFFWAVVYVRRGSSIAPMVSHSGFNALEILRVAIVGT